MKFLDFSFLKDSTESANSAVKENVKRRKGKRLNYTRPTKKIVEEPTPVSEPMEEKKSGKLTRRKSLRERYS
mgnify:CR=1 FL=1|tara:strand:- start:3097 stop:3312 length:216 start_codon:yes stop_codon:yes gene_type:complete